MLCGSQMMHWGENIPMICFCEERRTCCRGGVGCEVKWNDDTFDRELIRLALLIVSAIQAETRSADLPD